MSGSWLKRNGDRYLTECRANYSVTILVGHLYSLPLTLLCWLEHTLSLSSTLPLSFPSLSHFSLYDTSKWSCRDVSPHPRLIGAQRSNQGRTNRTVLVISCDQCSLGSWCAGFCHHAWACIVTWADPWLDMSGDTEIGTAQNTDQVWSHWSLLSSKTHRKDVNISHAGARYTGRGSKRLLKGKLITYKTEGNIKSGLWCVTMLLSKLTLLDLWELELSAKAAIICFPIGLVSQFSVLFRAGQWRDSKNSRITCKILVSITMVEVAKCKHVDGCSFWKWGAWLWSEMNVNAPYWQSLNLSE